ncbi:alpha/beta hydrolase, partial [Rhodopseudomonas sp. B29]|uniref:alpha/beta hydrolase n=1 Tax=Rhodopseudomonas sp. B29 TaxID=95607 RepID=UPI0003B68CF1
MNLHTRTDAHQHSFLDKSFEVDVETDVTYGVGGVGYDPEVGPAHYRPLKLDIYRPRGAGGARRPALIMAFGGAFLRGSKGTEIFAGENPSTAVAEYCHEFARRGFVCFSIDYRLMQEAPDPGVTPTLLPGQQLSRDRIDYVRGQLGLPPSTPQMLADTLEAATDDMTRAISFVRARSQAFGVDCSRIAIGGFSAGAILALNSAFAERAPVAAVVALSGRIAPATLKTYVDPQASNPAALMMFGEKDLPTILAGLDRLPHQRTAAGI